MTESVKQTREQLAARIQAVRGSLRSEERVRRLSGERTSLLRQEISRLRERLQVEPPTR